MRIAITADQFIPVPPVFYGGIERVIDLLIAELRLRGHEVTLFAHRDSAVSCELVPYPAAGFGWRDNLLNSWTITRTVARSRFDLIHSFGRLAYLLPLLPAAIPKLMCYQREPTLSQIRKAVRLAKGGTLAFCGCSNYISGQIRPFATAYTVYNGVDLAKYTPAPMVPADAPLVFLGRIEPIKGTHTAVEVALKTGRQLRIAGNIPEGCQPYFDQKIKPYLGSQIEYLGPVNDVQKAQLLQKSLALLMPIHWNEPFGIVMIEAMAAGTPVIGFNRGAVPEVIRPGLNGFVAETTEEMIAYTGELGTIDRGVVRRYAEKHFSGGAITDAYLGIYERLTANRKKNERK
jgi:glycosyltransferase involved in cell wall biosynthesis